jgi:hypothetical protein
VARELSVGDCPHAQSGCKLELGGHREPDEGCHGSVGPPFAVQRALELGVGTIERLVIPVESAAGFGRRDEEAHQNGAEERLVLGGLSPDMGSREDRGGRLALQLLERDQSIVPTAKPRGALLDERPDERPVLVEGRAGPMLVLDERDGEVGAVVELAEQERERSKDEAPQGRVEVWSSRSHATVYAFDG